MTASAPAALASLFMKLSIENTLAAKAANGRYSAAFHREEVTNAMSRMSSPLPIVTSFFGLYRHRRRPLLSSTMPLY